MPLIAAGLLLNVVVVVLNFAMPVSVDAAARAGLTPPTCASATTRSTSAIGPHTRLADLGDTIPVALPMQPQVVSPGDVLSPQGWPAARTWHGRRVAGTQSRLTRTARHARRVLDRESTTRGSYS